MAEPLINFDCPQCGQNLSAALANAGASFPCPSCRTSVSVPRPPPQPRVVLAERAKNQLRDYDGKFTARDEDDPDDDEPGRGTIVQKSEAFGAGGLLQLLGLAALIFGWWSLIGIAIGLTLLIWGGRISYVYRCSLCANKVTDRNVRVCPSCRAPLSGLQKQSQVFGCLLLLVLVAAIIAILVGLYHQGILK